MLIISCSSQNTEQFSSFDTIHKIDDYEIVFNDSDNPLGRITQIKLADSLIIARTTGDDYFFTVINPNNGEIINRVARRGRADNEYISVSRSYSIDNNHIFFLDVSKKELNSIKLEDFIKNKNPISKKNRYPYNLDFRAMNLCVVNQLIIYRGAFSFGQFGVTDHLGNIINYSSKYPFDCSEIPAQYRGITFQSQIESNNRQSKFVISNMSSDVFEIFNVTGRQIEHTHTNEFNNPPQSIIINGRPTSDDSKNIAGLLDVAVSDSLICFTYSAEPREKWINGDYSTNEIFCFDWQGNKVAKYSLPVAITNFCVDNNYIYGIVDNQTSQKIYKFKL